MSHIHPHSTARVGGHPLHPMIVPFPIAFFLAALVSDVVYLSNGRSGFAEASVWLIGAGLAAALLAAVLGLADFLGDRMVRGMRTAWLHMVGNVLAVAIEAVSLYVRSTQGMEASVAPTGVTLSAVTAVILLGTGWLGGELVYRHGVGVDDESLAPARVRED